MAKASSKATIDTKFHDDGAVSHKVVFAGGESRTILIKANHALAQHFIAHGSKAKIQAAINSVDDESKAIAKLDELDKGFDAGRWSLQGEGKPKAGILAQALAALKGSDLDTADAYVKTLSRAEQAKLRANPTVAAKIIEIEAKSRAEESGDLLGSFLGSAESNAEAA